MTCRRQTCYTANLPNNVCFLLILRYKHRQLCGRCLVDNSAIGWTTHCLPTCDNACACSIFPSCFIATATRTTTTDYRFLSCFCRITALSIAAVRYIAGKDVNWHSLMLATWQISAPTATPATIAISGLRISYASITLPLFCSTNMTSDGGKRVLAA